MKATKTILLCFLLSLSFATTMSAFTQNNYNVDSLIRSIPDSITKSPDTFASYLKGNFDSDTEIAKVLYIWLVKRMYYDLDMLEMPMEYENQEQMILQTLQTRRGVCQNYAETFTGILNKSGISTVTVHGYVKVNDKVDTKIGHAWNAALIENMWHLFDPTWGGGYVRYERFHPRFSMDYFKVSPDSLLSDHMPFDPMWQLIENPIKHDEFFEGRKSTGDHPFNCIDSINAYMIQSAYSQAKWSQERQLLYNISFPQLTTLKEKEFHYLDNVRRGFCIECYNQIVTKLNQLLTDHKNHRISKNQEKTAVTELSGEILECKSPILELTSNDSIFAQTGKELLFQISEIEDNIKYLSGNK